MKTATAQPFTNMAISLSGGGYRATTFHLGALSYLHTLKYKGENMLQRVSVLSTISGGTLTGVMYALYCAKGGTFEQCYDKLYELLEEDKLLERAFEKLNQPSKWKDQTKTKDLINAFSEVYNEFFYENATFEDLFKDNSSHLKDVIFGSTEFTHGQQFRFTENDDKGKFGNGKLFLPDEAAKNIRLSDVAAASSCFPGGFEPLIMTKDFEKEKNGPITQAWEKKNYQVTGIMDGGVIDNQGIEGVELAESRHSRNKNEPFIGTYIISDVSGKTMKPYQVPTISYTGFKNFFSFNTINWIVGIFVLGIIATLVFTPPLPLFAIVILSSLLTLGVSWFLLFYVLHTALMNTLRSMIGKENEPHLFSDMNVLLRTPVYILVYLVKMRATSVIKMVSDIFLRRIRKLQLDRLYSDRDWNYRIKSNNIYTLKEEPDLGDDMMEVVNAANSMPTTLWFSDKERKGRTLDKLIACGQFTMCFNLKKYIETIRKRKKVWETLDEATIREIEELEKYLTEDFEKFKKNPLRLIRKQA